VFYLLKIANKDIKIWRLGMKLDRKFVYVCFLDIVCCGCFVLLSVEAVILKDDGTARSVIRPMGGRLPGLITAGADVFTEFTDASMSQKMMLA